ncbi:MAG TPA: rhomboid family intramembrane serine protease [Bacteroidales bacterium]|nr:rhomboid family intramembrane serine protease [Bacteroidales bacterium]
MRENFYEVIKNKSDKELEIISKDHVFYSAEERLYALDELENRNKLSDEFAIEQKKLIDSFRVKDEDLEPRHKISLKDFIPHENYLITPILLYTNVFVFLLMILSGVHLFAPNIESLIAWGGNLRYLTIHGQFWRLLTSTFVHAGIIHLVANMYALLFVGAALEKAIGKNKFLFSYLATGILASLSSLIFHDNIVSIGASGAIFGLFGVLLALLLSKQFNFADVSKKNLLSSVGLFIFYNIIYGFNKAGIDNAAHIGGLLGGFIIGLLYYLIIKEKLKSLVVYISIPTIIVIGIFYAFNNVPDNFGKYDSVIKEFSMNEQKALWMYHENNNPISDNEISQYKKRLDSEGIQIWERNKELLSELLENEYPDQIQKQIKLLIDYTDLRIESCEIMIKLVDNETDELNQQFMTNNTKIENIINELQEINKNNR